MYFFVAAEELITRIKLTLYLPNLFSILFGTVKLQGQMIQYMKNHHIDCIQVLSAEKM